MKQKMSESQALNIMRSADVGIMGKFLYADHGLNGLKACSAFDHLVNHCGYKGSIHHRITAE